jgi:hypothetical protein
MPVTWDLDVTRKRLRVTVTDPYSYDDLETAARETFAAGFEPSIGVLVDRREASAPDSEDIQRMARFLEGRKHRVMGARAAVIVNSVEAYGMHRMFSAYADLRAGFHIEIFKDERSAEAWLSAGS